MAAKIGELKIGNRVKVIYTQTVFEGRVGVVTGISNTGTTITVALDGSDGETRWRPDSLMLLEAGLPKEVLALSQPLQDLFVAAIKLQEAKEEFNKALQAAQE